MKSIKKVVFGVMVAATVCAFVSCKSQGEKLADEVNSLQAKAEKVLEKGNMVEYQKLMEDIQKVQAKAEKLSPEEAAKFLNALKD